MISSAARERKRQLWQALHLIRLLSETNEGYTKADLAKLLGVHPRTVSRMISAIGECFYIHDDGAGQHKRYFIDAGTSQAYTAPTVTELAALQAKATEESRDGGIHAVALRALHDKLLLALKPASKRKALPDLEVLADTQRAARRPRPMAQVDPEALSIIQDALLCGTRLDIEYRRANDEEWHSREVEPLGVVTGAITYLLAGPMIDGAPRQFRLDRMRKVSLSDKPYTPPAEWNLDHWLSESVGQFHGDMQDVVIRVRASGTDRARSWSFHPDQRIEPDGDELIVSFRAAGMYELADHLFCWGDTVRIEAPEMLRSVMRERLVAAARQI